VARQRAHNVHALGATVLPVGLLGQDAAGDEVHALFRQAGIGTDGVSREAGRPTPVKTRIMAGGYQARGSRWSASTASRRAASRAAEARLIETLRAVGAAADGFLVSDYGYGTVTPRVYETVLELGRARKGRCPSTAATSCRASGAPPRRPNEPEVEALTGQELTDDAGVEKAGRVVLERLDARLLLLTRGSRGMALFEREGPSPSCRSTHRRDRGRHRRGATPSSAPSRGAGRGHRAGEAAWLANVAGGVVVMKRGNRHRDRPELAAALASDGGRRQR